MTLRIQIDALQKKRNAHLDAMEAASIVAANDNRLFSADEQQAFDKDQAEVRDIDAQLTRLIEAEKQIAGRALPIPVPGRASATVIPFKGFPGQAFTRYIGALARSKGSLMQAAELSKVWDDETPDVGVVLRAAVAAGTTSDPTWAAPLI